MSDQPAQALAQAAPSFRINAIYIKDVSFENPQAPNSLFSQAQKRIAVNVDVNIAGSQENTFELVEKVSVKATAEDDGKAVFLAEVLYGGLFTLNSELSPAEQERTLLVDCAQVIFPFVRRVIADMVSDGGFPPLFIDPINFEAIFDNRKSQAAA